MIVSSENKIIRLLKYCYQQKLFVKHTLKIIIKKRPEVGKRGSYSSGMKIPIGHKRRDFAGKSSFGKEQRKSIKIIAVCQCGNYLTEL